MEPNFVLPLTCMKGLSSSSSCSAGLKMWAVADTVPVNCRDVRSPRLATPHPHRHTYNSVGLAVHLIKFRSPAACSGSLAVAIRPEAKQKKQLCGRHVVAWYSPKQLRYKAAESGRRYKRDILIQCMRKVGYINECIQYVCNYEISWIESVVVAETCSYSWWQLFRAGSLLLHLIM